MEGTGDKEVSQSDDLKKQAVQNASDGVMQDKTDTAAENHVSKSASEMFVERMDALRKEKEEEEDRRNEEEMRKAAPGYRAVSALSDTIGAMSQLYAATKGARSVKAAPVFTERFNRWYDSEMQKRRQKTDARIASEMTAAENDFRTRSAAEAAAAKQQGEAAGKMEELRAKHVYDTELQKMKHEHNLEESRALGERQMAVEEFNGRVRAHLQGAAADARAAVTAAEMAQRDAKNASDAMQKGAAAYKQEHGGQKTVAGYDIGADEMDTMARDPYISASLRNAAERAEGKDDKKVLSDAAAMLSALSDPYSSVKPSEADIAACLARAAAVDETVKNLVSEAAWEYAVGLYEAAVQNPLVLADRTSLALAEEKLKSAAERTGHSIDYQKMKGAEKSGKGEKDAKNDAEEADDEFEKYAVDSIE